MVPIALNSSQPFWRSLIRPMLLLSLGLHGLLLMLPTSSNPKPEPPAEQKVSLTELPTENHPVASPSARPSATPRLVVKPAARPVTPPLPRRVDAPPPLRSAIIPRQAPQQATPAQPVPTPTVAAAAATTPAPASPTAPPADPFTAGFPVYPGAQPGSFGLPSQYNAGSRRTTDEMSKVDNFFVDRLQAAGYEITTAEQSGRIAYQVTKSGQTRYLTLIPNQEDIGTSIILSEQPLPSDLGSGSVESPAVARFYSDLQTAFSPDWKSADDLLLTQSPAELLSSPTDFYSDAGGAVTPSEQVQGSDSVQYGGGYALPEPRAGNVRAVVGDGDSQTVYNTLASQLSANQFDIKPGGDYGGGTYYEVSRTDTYTPESVTRYLVLVPTLDGAKTFIFIWDRRPGT